MGCVAPFWCRKLLRPMSALVRTSGRVQLTQISKAFTKESSFLSLQLEISLGSSKNGLTTFCLPKFTFSWCWSISYRSAIRLLILVGNYCDIPWESWRQSFCFSEKWCSIWRAPSALYTKIPRWLILVLFRILGASHKRSVCGLKS